MQLLEFGQRFLNYKAIVKIINNHTAKVEFQGMFMDCPYRFLRFANVVRCELDYVNSVLAIYISSNSPMYHNTQTHFLNDVIEVGE